MSNFVAGQVWRYNTRPGEEASRVTILKVEPDERLGNIIHVAVHGVRIQAAASPGGVCHTGYHTWRQAFDDGKAGVWTLSLADTIGAMESTLSG